MSFTVTIKTRSRKSIEAMLLKFGNVAEKSLHRGMYLSGEHIMGESKEHHVPVDTSTLKNSGYVTLPKTVQNRNGNKYTQGSAVVVELGYGGFAADYALKVHEDLDAFHVVGSAKYLEIPWNENINNEMRKIRKRIRRDVRSQTPLR